MIAMTTASSTKRRELHAVMNESVMVMNRPTNSSTDRPTTTSTSVTAITTISHTVNSRIRSWLRHKLSGALRPKALRSECIRHPEARMGNQMEKMRLNHSS